MDPQNVTQETDGVSKTPNPTAVADPGANQTPTPDAGPAPPIESALPTDEAPYGRNLDGTPAKKRGRKKAGETAERLDSVSPAGPRPPARSAIPAAPVIPVDYQGLGNMAANLFFNVGVLGLGEAFVPDNTEGPLVAGAFRDYFKHKAITAIDPGYALAIVLFSYCAKRTTEPTIKSRVAGGLAWVRAKLSRR
jgi:hypothetical protein